jgi:hypothetical protein
MYCRIYAGVKCLDIGEHHFQQLLYQVSKAVFMVPFFKHEWNLQSDCVVAYYCHIQEVPPTA